jgi:hypothetical protein
VTTTLKRDTVWRPYEDEPLFVPQMLLGFDALEPTDAERLTRYLTALVARRGIVHTVVAFNAVYLGYDLSFGGYVGGPVDFDRFEQVTFGETTAALPVGAMVKVAVGADPLFAEVIYKEGAHPALRDDGDLPGWLSGAPAGARGPDSPPQPQIAPVLTERLVVDFDAFGSALVATPAMLDRLRRRGKWLDADGHLLLEARYAGAEDAEAADTEFYAQYLLTRGREQLLAGPLPLLLTEDAGEEHLAAAVRAALDTIAAALASIDALRTWRGYAFARTALGSRLASHGVLGGDDLAALAAAISRPGSVTRRRFAAPTGSVRYTAVGPLLRTVSGAAPQLAGPGYVAAVCHANAVLSDYARREADDDGVLSSGAHLRLDDGWQGGGVWRASDPPGPYAHVDPLIALGLGWIQSQQPPAAEQPPQPPAEPELTLVDDVEMPDDLDSGADLLSVTDSHLSWTVTLRLAHTLTGVAALPGRVAEEFETAGLVGAKLRLRLAHEGYDLDPQDADQAVTVTQVGSRARLTGIDWPLEFFPGIVLTFTWQPGAVVLWGRSTLLEAPVTIDSTEYEHRYDPAVLTRDTAPGCARRGNDDHGPLTLRQRVVRAVRRAGHLDPDGVAVLRRDLLADLVYGRDAGPAGVAALEPVIDAMLADGTLTVGHGSVGAAGLQWPADGPGEQVPVLVWQPRPVVGPPRQSVRPQPELSRYVREYSVAPFLRRLPKGAQASLDKHAEYKRLLARYGRAGDLPLGYTLVDGHTRRR